MGWAVCWCGDAVVSQGDDEDGSEHGTEDGALVSTGLKKAGLELLDSERGIKRSSRAGAARVLLEQ